jgi:two-component system cell cycle sensor histidine kinase/response regulator CckA
VVEDDSLVRRVLKRTLERHGYQTVVVDCAAKAREAWAARGGTFALVISDVVMPGENGLLLCQALREDRPELPILIITGFAPAELVGDSGRIDYPVLAKPFTTAQLVASIRTLLQ